ncbi:hypothetical protein O6H91_22G032300 [Diphasiastrum complanatum]|uniref:Uncharacterized protein n=1 Tax=Diphasiastrum complanatum TaxID=34168 RepID=A0ACC2AE84_DIPCM|nr:hypothetical protein O6H91_22G032300 [Diphasiastrum complanatum]
MFYSHQLLSKKGPLGQIWIAATLSSKINRKKAEQIDIGEMCKQILNPVVPLALRLSSILMGGIVVIYHRKVKFLYDDAKEFLMQIKTVTAIQKVDTTSLPKGRSHARFQAITINYEFDEVYDDIEYAMLRPQTPNKDQEPSVEFFVVPNARPMDENLLNQPLQDFQAETIDITLNEDIINYPDILDAEARQEEDRILAIDEFALDNLVPVGSIQDELIVDELAAIFEQEAEQHKEQEQEKHESPAKEFLGPQSPEPELPPKPSRRGKRKNKKLQLDEEITEVPASNFNSWLQDTSSIIYRSQHAKVQAGSEVLKVQKLLSLPSTCLANNGEAESEWPTPLMELWNMHLSGWPMLEKSSEKEQVEDLEPASNEEPVAREGHHATTLDNVEDDVMPPLELDIDIGHHEFLRYGSVEKLRRALDTPNAGSEEEFLGNQLGLTPILTGQSFRSSRRKRTPQSGRLVLDSEGEAPTTGRSKRSRVSETWRSDSPFLGDYSGRDFLLNIVSPRLSGGNLEHRSESLPGSLSQFELLEETGPSQALNPRNSVDIITASMLQYLREQFNRTLAQKQQSLNKLTEGLAKSQAAKVFFQICVLASNRYLVVVQTEPYGDILISRGDYI